MELGLWLDQQGLTPLDVANWCDVSIRTVYRWMSGRAFPRHAHLAIIGVKTNFSVTSDDFHGLTEPRRTARRAARAIGEERR